MAFEAVNLKTAIVINKIYTIHYFEYMSDFSFAGESHDFWEFLCVDKGEVNAVADSHSYSLKKDDIIFHKPNEFHSVQSNGLIAPNLVVISFECNSPAMEFFKEKILTIGESERSLLAQIIMESRNIFSTALDDPYFTKMERRESSPFGAEQLVKIHLEQMLIQMIRRYNSMNSEKQAPKILKAKNDYYLYEHILFYLEQHLHAQLTIEQICKDNLIGRSQLQKLFREYNNCGVIDYFIRMKISLAKQLIRNNQLNFTQIADTLGYTSIHYFSRQFKQCTGLTPSEYSSSIMKLSEPPVIKP